MPAKQRNSGVNKSLFQNKTGYIRSSNRPQSQSCGKNWAKEMYVITRKLGCSILEKQIGCLQFPRPQSCIIQFLHQYNNFRLLSFHKRTLLWRLSGCTLRTLIKRIFHTFKVPEPITVAVRSKAWTLLAGLNTGVLGSNPTRGMDVYVRLSCVCVILCVGRGLAMGWSPVQGVLQAVYRLKNWKSGQGPTKGCTAIIEQNAANAVSDFQYY
jgi:hypothetical protein